MISPPPGEWATVRRAPRTIDKSLFLDITLNRAYNPGPACGQFFLARCGIENSEQRFSSWDAYLPVPLYTVASRPNQSPAENPDATQLATDLSLHLPEISDPRHEWLSRRTEGEKILLFGPYGNRFAPLQPGFGHNLLLIGDSNRILSLLDLVHRVMDSGGKVTLLQLETMENAQPTRSNRQTSSAQTSVQTDTRAEALIQIFPLQTEVHTLPADHFEPGREFASGSQNRIDTTEIFRWADLIVMAVDASRLHSLAYELYTRRFQPQRPKRKPRRTSNSPSTTTAGVESSLFAFVEADYLCGYGACLACTVPTAGGGVTRACIHGPILPLSRLVDP